ncbi:hypothetical protein [Bacteroides faecalis]|uniref:hypothetical protein n=1 Tax=Bacteroides faecalis TaxID=2447885 RepID=UPI000F623619|nr:hypothetical protein [Bacteroides faecalis]
MYILIRRTIGTRHSGYTCRAVIIRSEYNELRRQGGHTSGYITRALADAYGLSRSAIDLIIYKKNPTRNAPAAVIRSANISSPVTVDCAIYALSNK